MDAETGATLRTMVDEFARLLEHRLGGNVDVNVDTVSGEDIRVDVTATLHLRASTKIEVKGYAIKHAKNPAELIGEVVGDAMKDFEKLVNAASNNAITSWEAVLNAR